jgi:hypothetical protein
MWETQCHKPTFYGDFVDIWGIVVFLGTTLVQIPVLRFSHVRFLVGGRSRRGCCAEHPLRPPLVHVRGRTKFWFPRAQREFDTFYMTDLGKHGDCSYQNVWISGYCITKKQDLTVLWNMFFLSTKSMRNVIGIEIHMGDFFHSICCSCLLTLRPTNLFF